ncbi:NUDIX domain-containing protein [Sphingomonas sp. ASY06-1R]|uniref:NUDIX domain-containing protein n=1 Tax=Sphingomonas sp. ASY06-1R TaxID=3445771 RepID=UPI003FA1ED28
MPDIEAEIVERRLIHDRWSTISDVVLKLPNGAIEQRVVEDHGDAAAVMLYDPDRRVALLVRQPRVPVLQGGHAPLLEVVAGRVEGKTPEDTARAEAMEEAGVAVLELEKVATLWPMPAVSTERISLFLAPYSAAQRTGPGGGAADENECITMHEVTLQALWALAEADQLGDAKTYILLQALKQRRPELFAS